MKHDGRKNSKDAIIEVAIDLFSQKGYTETSMREIATGAGIRASSIYNHFTSKEAILLFVLKEYDTYSNRSQMHRQPVTLRPEETTVESISTLMFYRYPQESYERFHKIMRFLTAECGRNPIITQFYRQHSSRSYMHIRRILGELAARGCIDCDVDTISTILYSISTAFRTFAVLVFDILD